MQRPWGQPVDKLHSCSRLRSWLPRGRIRHATALNARHSPWPTPQRPAHPASSHIAGAMLSSTAGDPFCSDAPRTREENLKNVRIAMRALAVATLFEGGLAACAINPDSNGHVDISGTTIADNAFNACTTLKSITIPDSVTSIGVVRSSRPPPHSSREPAG